MSVTLIGAALVVTVLAQWVVAALVYYDATRLNHDRPGDMSMAIWAPLGGFVVIAVYLSERKRLAKTDAS